MTIVQSQPNLTQLAPSVIYDEENEIVYFGCGSEALLQAVRDMVQSYLKTFAIFSRCEDMEVREMPEYITLFPIEIAIRDMQYYTDSYAHGVDTLAESENLKHWDKNPSSPTAKLSEEKLRELSNKHDRSVNNKHTRCWKHEHQELIEYLKVRYPKWDDRDLYEKIGDEFVDWMNQELQDEKDWEEAFNEVSVGLNRLQRNQLRCFLMGEDYNPVAVIPTVKATDLKLAA